MGYPKISTEGDKANNQDLTSLLSKDITANTWAVTVDPCPSTNAKRSWREVGSGSNLEPGTSDLSSPRNFSPLTDDHLFQADRENSDSSNPENQNMNTRHRKKMERSGNPVRNK